MYTHRLRIPGVRRALVTAVAGALAAGALAGPAMAATDDGSSSIVCRKAGEKPIEYLRATSGDKTDVFHSGGVENSIIAVL